MQKFLRWSAVSTAMLIVLAACTPAGSGSPSGSQAAASASLAADPAAACDALPNGCFEVAAGEPLTIASALSITGDTAFLGNDSNFGIQVAQDERGKVLNRDVEVIKEDAGCGDAATGQTAAQSILGNPAILGVIGTTCSRTAVTAMQVLGPAHVVMVSPSNTAPGLTNPDHEQYGGEFFFRTAYNDKVQGAAVAKYACEVLKVDTAATIHDGSPYAEQLQQVFADQFKSQCSGTVTSQNAIGVGDVEFHSVLTKIAAETPKLIFMPIFDPEGPLIVNQSRDLPALKDTIFFGADGVKDAGFVKAAGKVAQEIGMYFSGPDLNFGTRYTDDFLPKLLALEGTKQPQAPYHAHGYDAYNILMDAIESAHVGDGADGTSFFSRDGIREHFAGLKDYAGLTGTLTCGAAGHDAGDCGSSEVSIAQLVDGVYTEVYTTRAK
ncbi:MAG TPA: branched-chain amino acid ABC transporter substrate-binding protein [Candidatus Limnocylindria bacterium]